MTVLIEEKWRFHRDVALAVGYAYAQPIDPSDTGYVWSNLRARDKLRECFRQPSGIFNKKETAVGTAQKAGGILFPDQRLGKFSRNSVANITRNVRKIFMRLLTQPSRFYRTFRFAI
jgi:hypothetical protein